jgi:hypothetical protein
LVHDGARLGIPPGFLNLFSRIPHVVETEKFLKRLEALAPPIRRSWEKTKRMLTQAITPGVDFKLWRPGGQHVYSVRVNDNFRAHLHRPAAGETWTALEIGSHKELGHG